MPTIKTVPDFNLADVLPGKAARFYVAIASDGLGRDFDVPILVARGKKSGPVVGVTAAVHGNELNGVLVAQRLLQGLQPKHLSGTVVAAPVVNVPGFIAGRREFSDGADLNRLFPGKPKGSAGSVYAHRLMETVISKCDYLIDLHTAGTGRLNSLYVRADMTDKIPAWMARLQRPQIVVHKQGSDGTLRGAAAALGIHAITVEVGNPQSFQQDLIRSSLAGIHNVLGHLKMLPLNEEEPAVEPIVCAKSHWLFTDCGGLLEVFPAVATGVKKGELVARVTSVFGDTLSEIRAPEDGVVIGKNANPVAQTGTRILHLGIVGKPRGDVRTKK